jgi:hypothetical protein
VPSEIALKIDYDDVTTITPDCTISGRKAAAYPALSERQQTRIERLLRRRYSDVAVDAVLGAIWDWKVSSYANHARTHERRFRRVLDIDAAERNGTLLGRSPRAEEALVAGDLVAATHKFLAHHFPDPIEVYRGTDVAVAQVFGHVLDEPNRLACSVESCPALVNVTTSEIIAREYGFLVVEAEIDAESVGLAPDFVLPYKRHGEIEKRDAELQLRGDSFPSIRTENIRLPSTGRPVSEALALPGQLREDEHEDLFNSVVRMDHWYGAISTDRGERLLERWLGAYQERASFERRHHVLKAERSIQRLLA